MVRIDYNDIMKRYDVKVPFTLADEKSEETIAVITEQNKIILHREISFSLLRQIMLIWDEYSYQQQRKESENGV